MPNTIILQELFCMGEKGNRMNKRMKRVVLPFTALVGQENLKKALVLNAINPGLCGVLIRGERGTAKSTAVRSLAELLPEIDVSKCAFHCSPFESSAQCDICNAKREAGEEVIHEKRKVQVVDLPLGATEDRVVGTIDIERALRDGVKALQPGILAEVNQGILYIDEVNLLDDHLVDVLLDSAAMGVNTIEREGVSLSHPSRFILVGTMNPEEGDLRPQLLDRFGLVVDVVGASDPDERVRIVNVVQGFQNDPIGFARLYDDKQEKLRNRIIAARESLNGVKISEELVRMVVDICLNLGVDGHRADFLIVRTAETIAAFNKRRQVIDDDVRDAAEFVLPHRMKRMPFEEPKPFRDEVKRIIGERKELARANNREGGRTKDGGNDQVAGGDDDSECGHDMGGMAEELFDLGELRKPQISIPKDLKQRANSGRRAQTLSSTGGRYIGFRIPHATTNDVALDATMRASIARTGTLEIKAEDVREKVRERKTSSVIVFVVDGSGSMGAMRRMEAAKGAVMALLEEAYQKRDKVGFIVFRRDKAEVMLSPTSSINLAVKHLKEIPTGGKTPLSDGLYKALMVLKREKMKNETVIPIMVLVSDCKGNVPMKTNVRDEVMALAAKIRDECINLVIIDSEDATRDLGYSQELIEVTGGTYYHLDVLDYKVMVNVIKPLTGSS